jgi:hypothetical protein
MVCGQSRKTSNLFGVAALCLAVGAGAAISAVATTVLVGSTPAQATAAYAKDTKLACTKCHSKGKASAMNLNDFGMKFQANGHKVP